jgi:hypothetical protein
MKNIRSLARRMLLLPASLLLLVFGGALVLSARQPAQDKDDRHHREGEREGPRCRQKPLHLGDPSQSGHHHVATTSYNLPNTISITATENGWTTTDSNVHLWAVVYYPGISSGLNRPVAPGHHPLVVYLHGNHGIWIDSSGDHICGLPTGNPVPNHEGYNYILERLASHGFIAVSINANDLNCKSGRIVARGKLILQHLGLWKDWNDPAKPDPTFGGRFHRHVDMNHIGLAGHSRGGEGVVSAYLENQTSGLGFEIKAVHSISPVDFDAFTLADVPYYNLMGAADGDVWDLEGARIYDRAAPRTNAHKMPKMQSYLYGANHNWFNTVWFQDEGWPSFGPNRITDVQQRAVERALGTAFFRQYLQGFTASRELFSSNAVIPTLAPAQFYRSFQDPKHLAVDDFEDTPPNPLLNSLGGANVSASLAPFGEFPFSEFGGAFNNTFFQDTHGLIAGWNAAGTEFILDVPPASKDVSAFRYLSFRVTQVFDSGALNPVGQTEDFDVGLEDLNGNSTYLEVGQFDMIPFSYDRPFGNASMLQTIRLGLPCFHCAEHVGLDIHAIAKIHFRFNRKPTGLVGLDDVQFSR